MRISVIIPIFNVETYLRQCIESVLSQTYQDMEIILVNDESTDGSKQICEEYARIYQNIKLINKANSGVADTRNKGILQATGDYLLFLDGDDYLLPNSLHTLIQSAEQNGRSDFIFFRYQRLFQQVNRIDEPQWNINQADVNGMSGTDCLQYLLEHNKGYKWYCWLYFLKRQFVIENALYFSNRQYYEDIVWTPKIFMKAKCVSYVDRPIIMYRLQRTGQLTSFYAAYDNLHDSIAAANYWYQEIQHHDISNQLTFRLLRNVADNYFVAIWYAGFLHPVERKALYHDLKQNRHLLHYTNSSLSKYTAILCHTLGYHLTSILFKIVITLKRKVRLL